MWTILFNKGILTVAVVLAIIGSTIKYRTGTNNELICLVLTILGILIWSIVGLVSSWDDGILFILWDFGIKRGILSSGIAVFAWDLFHGTAKGCSCKHKDSAKREKEGDLI